MNVFPSNFINGFFNPSLDINVQLIQLANVCCPKVEYEVVPWNRDVAWVFDFIQQGAINLMTIYSKPLGMNRTYYIDSTVFDLMVSNFCVLSLDISQLIVNRVNMVRSFIAASIGMENYNFSKSDIIINQVRSINAEFNETILQNAINDHFGSMQQFKEACIGDFSNYMASIVYIYNRSLVQNENIKVFLSIREWNKWLINKYKPKHNIEGVIA